MVGPDPWGPPSVGSGESEEYRTDTRGKKKKARGELRVAQPQSGRSNLGSF